MRYAVVFKTYTWDAFVERQASRCRAAAGAGDFYISMDETNNKLGDIPFDRIVRTSNAKLVARGFADRFEQGSLIWWNADYVHYEFHELYPDYDYYVFVEYDVIVQGDLGPMVERIASLGADFTALPLSAREADYFWTLPHRQVYAPGDIRAALACISIFSPRALTMLARRRRDMAADPAIKYWPLGELFVPTEIDRAGYKTYSLADLGDTSRYLWFPPILEQDVGDGKGPAFLHPVLDHHRYIRSIINNCMRFRSFVYARSQMYRSLSRFPKADYANLLLPAARRRLRMSLDIKLKRTRLRLAMLGRRSLGN